MEVESDGPISNSEKEAFRREQPRRKRVGPKSETPRRVSVPILVFMYKKPLFLEEM